MSTTAGSSSAPPFLEVNDPGFALGAPEVLAAQERSWYANSSVGLLVLRYREARELLRDQRLNGNGQGYMEMNGVVGGPLFDWFVAMIANQEGEVHGRLRGLVSKAFSPRTIVRLRPFIRDVAERHVERLGAGGVCDFVRDFGSPLPHAVMCELLGVPDEDYDVFGDWTADITWSLACLTAAMSLSGSSVGLWGSTGMSAS